MTQWHHREPFRVEAVRPAPDMLAWGSRWWRDGLGEKRSRCEPRTLAWDGHPLEVEEQGMGFSPESPQTWANETDFELLSSRTVKVTRFQITKFGAASCGCHDKSKRQLLYSRCTCLCVYFFFWPNGIMERWWFHAVWKLLESIPSIATLKKYFHLFLENSIHMYNIFC